MTELSDIIQTIREVEVSLERRSQRAGALVMTTWGIVATAIFLFYAFVQRDPEPLVARMGETAVQWAWVPPIVLGYLFSALAQVRLGRMKADRGARSVKRLLALLLVPLVLLVTAELTGFGWQLIPAMWVAFLGYMHLTWHGEGPHRSDRVIAIASFAAAIALALPPLWEWANFLAAGWYAVFLAGHGLVRYHSGA